MNEITYDVTIADMKALQRHFRRVSPAYRRGRLLLLVLAAAAGLHSSLTWTGGGILFRFVLGAVVTVLLWALMSAIAFAADWLVQSRMIRDSSSHGILGEHTMTLTDAALRERTAVNDSRSAWRGIHRIDTTAEHIFIFIQPNMAHVIPRRAFPSPEEADRFAAAAKDFLNAERSRFPSGAARASLSC